MHRNCNNFADSGKFSQNVSDYLQYANVKKEKQQKICNVYSCFILSNQQNNTEYSYLL